LESRINTALDPFVLYELAEEVPIDSIITGRMPDAGAHLEPYRILDATGHMRWLPIKVNRETMVLMDGRHRLMLARERGDTHIKAILWPPHPGG